MCGYPGHRAILPGVLGGHPENTKMSELQPHIASDKVHKKIQIAYESYSIRCDDHENKQ